ncbi:glycosyltransferase [Luteipulveratus sp. YIM 133132]|uniref:glycosyltransferase n=1 Tax=Luteipulveratus flavus TaxID=3031728 RepID=UPI0023B0C5E3|nr:glycosyltransferase [Luteipulveratus sp. YIM 133132]MDE9366456.1 glycosyltransferase [Luteipulveratus sp. YIM 133132]
MSTDPRLSVVIPYYQQPEELARCLLGLEQQTGAPSFEVVVADDGSDTPPVLATDLDVRVVRQDDLGFRAAAARNLGARCARGRRLVFVDADCVPTPGFLRAMDEGSALVVGHRQHLDMDGWSRAELLSAFEGSPVFLAGPAWLRHGYDETDDLRRADDASFRFVISAALSAPTDLFWELGGFDADLVGYGGEDWDLGHRWWTAGLDLLHRPEAQVWHHGPDLPGRREDWAHVKNAETAALASRIPHPVIRGSGSPVVHRIPRTAVQLDLAGCTAGQALLSVEDWLTAGDVAVFVGDADVPGAFVDDPRVRRGSITDDVRARSLVWFRATGSVRSATGHGLAGRADPALGVPAADGAAPVAWVTGRAANAAVRSREPVPWRSLPRDSWRTISPGVLVEQERSR